MNHPSLHLENVRLLAQRYDAQAIEHCLQLALENKSNPCYTTVKAEEIMNVLAKTGFVLNQVKQGKSVNEAIRELGKRIRASQINMPLQQ